MTTQRCGSQPGHSARHRFIVGKTGDRHASRSIGKTALDVIERERPLHMPRDLHPLPRGQVVVNLAAGVANFLLHRLDLGLEIDIVLVANAPSDPASRRCNSRIGFSKSSGCSIHACLISNGDRRLVVYKAAQFFHVGSVQAQDPRRRRLVHLGMGCVRHRINRVGRRASRTQRVLLTNSCVPKPIAFAIFPGHDFGDFRCDFGGCLAGSFSSRT